MGDRQWESESENKKSIVQCEWVSKASGRQIWTGSTAVADAETKVGDTERTGTLGSWVGRRREMEGKEENGHSMVPEEHEQLQCVAVVPPNKQRQNEWGKSPMR